jgi:hypothetical protein
MWNHHLWYTKLLLLACYCFEAILDVIIWFDSTQRHLLVRKSAILVRGETNETSVVKANQETVDRNPPIGAAYRGNA